MKGDKTADRLASERPIRALDGTWDVGVYLDHPSLIEMGVAEEAAHLQQLAQDAGLPVLARLKHAGSTSLGTLFLIAHRDERDQTVCRILEAGRSGAYRDRYVILAVCGEETWRGAHKLATILIQEFGALGVDIVESRVEVAVGEVCWLLRALIQLGEARQDLLPSIAINRARGIVLRAREEANHSRANLGNPKQGRGAGGN